LYELAKNRGVIDDGCLWDPEMIVVVRAKDNIRARVVEE
jgi:hypothetical protein